MSASPAGGNSARKEVAVVVLEQAPEPSVVGASLQLGPNAMRLLDELGMLPAPREIGVHGVDLLRCAAALG